MPISPNPCNATAHCQIKGMILAFVPEGAFRLVSGQEKLSEYRFYKHVIAHQFCQVCGVQPFGFGTRPDGAKMAAINMRCVDGIEPDELSPRKFDGRKL
jgi:hypothetical protein